MTKKHRRNFQQQIRAPKGSIDQVFDRAMQLHQHGDFQQAEQLYRQVLQAQPRHSHTKNLLGVLLSQYNKDHARAQKLITEAIRIDPDVADYHNNLGLVLQQLGKFEEAARSFRQAIHVDPAFTMAWFGLGNVSVGLGDAATAVTSYQKALEGNPRFFAAMNNLGNVYRTTKNFNEAENIFNHVLEQKPDFAEAWYNLGMLYKSIGNGEGALAAFDRVLALKPRSRTAWCMRGVCRKLFLRDALGALDDFDQASSIDTRFVPSYLYKADIYRDLGRFEESENELRKALDIDGSAVGAYLGLVSSKACTEQDLYNMQSALDEIDLDPQRLVYLHFALGKIFQDRCEYEKAFRHLEQGNRLYRSTYQYEHHSTVELHYSLMRTFDKQNIERYSKFGSDSELPVFVLGMPRSGTTLVEQIIGAHPQVHAAGELEFFGRNAIELVMRQQIPGQAPDWSLLLNETDIRRLASAYLARLRNLNADALRITEKMPHNFQQIGLIAILFPNARIIHCRRHPLDNCLSIYEQLFNVRHHYAYDLRELGWYYREYLRLMQHWEEVVPGRIIHVQYEELVGNPEDSSRKLIHHVGLSWDERCLEFYKTERMVSTISQWQVRQKIYTSSINRWRNYEPWLSPLIEALGDAVPDRK